MNISQRTLSAGVVISLATVVLTGCATPPQEINQPAEATAIESTLTEEQALALAEETYAEYLAISDQIARDGGRGVEALSQITTESFFVENKDLAEKVQQDGLRTEGKTVFDSFSVQNYSQGESFLTAYSCVRLGNINVFDSSGVNVTPNCRLNDVPMEITFEVVENKLQIKESRVWSGSNFCL
jgi:hypothetical protein